MTEVRYYCPRCGAIATLDREGYLADKSVTPYPLAGWEYADPGDDFEDAEGVRFVCGESEAAGVEWTGVVSEADDVERLTLESPCGRDFYLSFVRFEAGEEVEPVPETEYVDIGL